MGALLGKQKKAMTRITEHDKALLQLKQQRDKIQQYQRRLGKNVDKNIDIARQLIAANQREKAKLVLKKKKYQEQLLCNAETQLEGLERMVHDIEFAQIELQVVIGLKVGNAALKKVNDMLNIEDIEMIMEESKEGIDKQREIEAVIAGAVREEDEAAVEEELLDIIGEKIKFPEVTQEELQMPAKEMKEKRKKDKQERVALEA